MSLAARITAGILLVVALGGGLAVYQLRLVDQLVADNRALGEVDVESLTLALQMWSRLGELEELGRKLRVLEDERYAQELALARVEFTRDLTLLETLTEGSPLASAADDVGEAWQRYLDAGAVLDDELTALEHLNLGVSGVMRSARADLSRHAAESASRRDRAQRLAWWWSAGVVAVGAVLAFLIAQSIAGPLARLAAGTREIAAGNFEHRVAPCGSREVADLAEDFNSMAVRLRELDDLKSDLLSNVSHDLKAPLASMQETAHLLLDEVTGKLAPQQRELVEIQLRSGERLSRMISDLLDLAQLEAGAAEPRRAPVDLAALVRRLASEFSPAAQARGIEQHVAVPDEEVRVAGDEDLLARAMGNLLENALKFSPEGGRMGIELARDPAGGEGGDGAAVARLVVWDTGPGIPDGDKEAVFTRFHRVDRSRRGSQGTGLGLAIAAQVAALHRGAIHVEDRPGGGSRLVMLLECVGEGESAGETAGEGDVS